MTEITTVTGGISARPGSREGAYPRPAGCEETRVDAGERTGEPSGAAAAGPDGQGGQGTQGGQDAHGGSPGVIAGAGPVIRPGERATLRLRDGADRNHGGHGGHDGHDGHDGNDDRPGGHDGGEEPARYAPEWLQLREPADAAARAADLLDALRDRLAALPDRECGLVVHDLGCGTGSMGRWLAPRLDGAQHWVLHDRDPYLLHFAAVASPRSAADGSRVSVETRRGDVARLTSDALAGASLVTASALLDVLTREEIDALAAACAGAGCPALLTLSVAGQVELAPADPLDAELAEAFNAHQRRTGLLGPDAVTVACEAFTERGMTVRLHPSPWRLGPEHAALTAQWLRGWVGAAVEQRPELRERAERYLAERLAACEAGELEVVVQHSDLLALPRPSGGAS
ncbi:class I SAM-dependent methyltransferase [Streptomyces collinus]|uniref:class I SAM-dependent methyltransferase n=1 Tax=Streptomyces collinus TaxID=42684 RepID=UPI0036F152AC